MELAVHMKNKKTGEERIKKVIGKNASAENWHCKDFHYGSEWVWTGTEPFQNVIDSVEHTGRGYYRRKVGVSIDNPKDFEPLPCKECGQTNVGVKDEVLDINFELGNTIKVWAYCRNCGAVGKFRTIRQCDDEVKIKLAYKEWNSDKTEEEEY